MDNRNPWIATADELPDQGILVETKIDDVNGVRNEQSLRREGRLWFVPDGSMYVYYTPTHWREMDYGEEFEYAARGGMRIPRPNP